MERTVSPFPFLESCWTVSFTFTVILIAFFSQSLQILGLIPYTTFSSSIIDELMSLCNALDRTELEYDSITWKFVTVTDSSKFGIINSTFVALCICRILIGNCNSII
jgi:hypothetical protein